MMSQYDESSSSSESDVPVEEPIFELLSPAVQQKEREE